MIKNPTSVSGGGGDRKKKAQRRTKKLKRIGRRKNAPWKTPIHKVGGGGIVEKKKFKSGLEGKC